MFWILFKKIIPAIFSGFYYYSINWLWLLVLSSSLTSQKTRIVIYTNWNLAREHQKSGMFFVIFVWTALSSFDHFVISVLVIFRLRGLFELKMAVINKLTFTFILPVIQIALCEYNSIVSFNSSQNIADEGQLIFTHIVSMFMVSRSFNADCDSNLSNYSH